MTQLPNLELAELAKVQRLLIATDFDGALAPVCSSPELARTPEMTALGIDRLRATGKVIVAVFSGRKLADLKTVAPNVDVLAGNHGLEISGAVNYVHPAALETRPLMAEARLALAETAGKWPGVWVEDKDLTVALHFRAIEDKARHEVLLAARGSLARFGTALGMKAGKCALEVHPRLKWNKVDAFLLMRERMSLHDCRCLWIGDDTDDNMFRVLSGETTVQVGGTGQTLARYRLENPSAVSELLLALARHMDSAVNPAAAAAT